MRGCMCVDSHAEHWSIQTQRKQMHMYAHEIQISYTLVKTCILIHIPLSAYVDCIYVDIRVYRMFRTRLGLQRGNLTLERNYSTSKTSLSHSTNRHFKLQTFPE